MLNFDLPQSPDEAARLEDLAAYEASKAYEAALRNTYASQSDLMVAQSRSPFSKLEVQ